jgi:hypothetical protein
MRLKDLFKTIINKIHIQLDKKKRDIFIFSTPRSGSTWLLQILGSNKRVKIVYEPFHRVNSKYYNPIKPKDRFLDLDDKQKNKVIEYFRKLSPGTVIPSRMYNVFSKNHSFITDRSVFKILRANELIDLFKEEFNPHILFFV